MCYNYNSEPYITCGGVSIHLKKFYAIIEQQETLKLKVSRCFNIKIFTNNVFNIPG